MGVSKLTCPFHMVPIQLKNFSPVGIAIRNVMKLKNGSSTAPVANMWCAHTATDKRRDRQQGIDHPSIPEQGFSGEHREDLGDDAEEGQGDDVHLGMAEEPEQMLIEDGSAVGRVEDV